MTDTRRNALSRKYIIQLFMIVLTTFSFTTAFSQTESSLDIGMVAFKDGTVIKGQVVQLNTDTITIWSTDDDIIIRKFDDVERLVKKDIFDLYGSSPQSGRAY